MKMVRIGFIGVGGMAQHHMKTLQNMEGVQLTAIFDINEERAKEVSAQFGSKTYASAEALLDSGEVDGVYICTPPFAREGIEEAAAKRGIHLLSEKPIGLDMEVVRRKEQIIKESGIIHTSGYCLRYLDIVQQAKEYLKDKAIHLVMSYRFGGIPPVKWWLMMEQSGGQLVEQSTHQLDLIRYLAGGVKEVSAIHEQRHLREVDPDATAYDVGTVSFVLESGAIGNITSTCLASYVGKGEIEFFGHQFYLSLNGSTLRIVDDEQDITIKSKVDFYYEQNKTFVEAIRTGNQGLLLGDFSDAADTLEVTLAANEAAETRKTVSLQLSRAGI
ncbi:Gfo/Idh/MocA family protein [Paenibacillus chungangensis]|uniref:Gfo/Idh/MocA family protein n=1 Tax=Paenibacillus chungangensis TaxID=696535 RepID=A0ABW3HT98_9BACL